MEGANVDPSDEEVGRIGHDPQAFEAFYRAHVDAVQRFVARRVNDPYLVADLTAEVFLAAIGSSHTYRPRRATPIAWLFGVARNVVAAERRRHARDLRGAGRIAGRRLVDSDDFVRLEERIDAEAKARDLQCAMDRLSESERAVLELVALDGLTVLEAAHALRISQVSARVRLHRARQRMREHLAPSIAAQPEEA
jgi:RNA polymerase sigma factor (sigma-70 family)